MKLGLLFSGGKDSCLALYKSLQEGYDVVCLLNVFSKNKDSFMFHTSSVSCVRGQSDAIGIPLVVVDTEGYKEEELKDLERLIKKAIEDFGVEGIVTGAVGSVYQSLRVQRICNNLGVECFNPLWQKNQIEILEELIRDKFEVIVVGVFAYPFDESWLGRKVDRGFIEEMKKMWDRFGINSAGEGGEFESFVLNGPIFKRRLRVKGFEDFGERNSWRREIKL